MDLFLTILAWIGIVLGTLLGLLLLVPLHARAAGRVSGLWGTGHVRASWGWFGLVFRIDPGRGARIKLFGIPIKRVSLRGKKAADEPDDEPDEEKKEKPTKKPGPGARQLWGGRRVLWRALMRMVATLHLRGRVQGQIGLDDPADTAMLELGLGQLRERVRAVDWWVACDYADEVLELEGRLTMWIWPVQVVWVGLVTWLSRDLRRVLRARA